MGRLTVENETYREYPATISMILGHLERENHAVVRESYTRDGCTEFIIDGDDIPGGLCQFQVLIGQVVPGVVRIEVIK
jgi:hypothetical protein